MSTKYVLVALVCLALISFKLQAGCTVVGNSTQNLGSFSSSQIATSTLSTRFSSNFSCSGFVNLLDYSRIDATLVAANFELQNANGDAIPYTLYTDAARSTPFVLNSTKEFGSFNLIDLLGLFGDDGTIPLYFDTAVANVSAGTYSDTIAIFWRWDYCSGIGLLGICIGRDKGSETIIINVQLTVTGSCSIQTTDVSLGSLTYLGNVSSAILPLNINCTKQLSYQYYVDGGDNFANGQRNMVLNAEAIPYVIKTTDGHTAVGPSMAHSIAGLGSGQVQGFQLLVLTIAEDRFPMPGVYRDQVRVIVEF
ncbi:spore coat protein U domain-containing protein [Alishewanella tabrizica]|uniref:Spore coat protein U/FanG domain-containing protein n=1 Tax=Alishewanella tabrizica TaxID=671278 RepID=A0ABQ2WMW2_9ALTE|nr:spore coat protein U domain-containing protein [Alishewanella tabrizica]GGW61752.1 hypothetical protein GCM10008111_17420 [Alishewanella tabrizica]